MTGPLPRWRRLLRPHAGWLALLAAAGLTWVGIDTIRGLPLPADQPDFAAAQVKWLPFAALAFVACLVPNAGWIGRATYPLMAVVLALLVFTILPFVPPSIVPVRNGARLWIDLRFMMLQPSEPAKVVFILALARYLRHRESQQFLRGLLVPFALMLAPMLIILKQPDPGTAILFPPVLFAVLAAAGARLRHLAALGGVGLAVVGLAVAAAVFLPERYQVLQRHQRLRIQALVSQHLGDDRYLAGAGYQQDKALTLVGSGQARGLGAQRSATMLRFNWLPEAHNDMIFAAIANRWGWRGGAGVLGLYLALVLVLLWIAARRQRPAAQLALVGFAALILTQITINIGMSLGLLPIIGITLPFVSYGGSSLVAAYAMLGLAVNFASEPPALLARPSFEFGRKIA